MKTIAEIVEKWAVEKWSKPPAFKQDADGDAATLKFTHESNCGDFDGYLEISNSNDMLVMYLYGSSAIPEKVLVPVMDAVTRINEDMAVGNVEIVRKKEVLFRFRAGIDVEDGSLSGTMLDNLLRAAIGTIERYFPAILSICFAGMMPEQAIATAREEAVEDPLAEKLILDMAPPRPLSENESYSSPALTAWADELSQAISTGADADAWRMVGHGAVIVHDDMERACEMLRRVAAQANIRFVRFESDEVFDIPGGMGDPLANAAPILAYFEPGDWMRKIDGDAGSEDAQKIRKFRKSLTTRMEAFDPEHPVIYTTSAYRLEDVTPVLRKRELFDRYFHIPELTPVMLGKEFIGLFLKTLADGGYQVGALAKLRYPGGIEVEERIHAAAEAQTSEHLQRENVVLFEPAIRVGDFFIRIDVLVKAGNKFELIEVKAKSYNSLKPGIEGKRGGIDSGMLPYIQDAAFQTWVLRQAFPDAQITTTLMMPDKAQLAPLDGINQMFKINERSDVEVRTPPGVDAKALAETLLAKVCVDSYVAQVLRQPLDFPGGPAMLGDAAAIWAEAYRDDRRIAPVIGAHCGGCQFKAAPGDTLKSGFHECWKAANGWEDQDFDGGTVLDLWNFRGKQKLIDQGVLKISQVTRDDLGDFDDEPDAGGLNRKQRQWLQVGGIPADYDCGGYYFDRPLAAVEMSRWRFPLHFIDFETSTVALPFYKGRRGGR